MDGERGGRPRVPAGQVPVVGFCFSFALEQTSLDSGALRRAACRAAGPHICLLLCSL
jgi:hypothetical protein